MNTWEENARDILNNGLYEVDERLYKYYSNIVNFKNRHTRVANEEIMKRRLNAMCIVCIEKQCTSQDKKGISKVYSNGIKLTIDRSKRLIKFIAVREVSKQDTKDFNIDLYDRSMHDGILGNLKIAYRMLGLNELGNMITDRKIMEKIETDVYNIWRDVYHVLENEYMLDAIKAKTLLDSVYTGEMCKEAVLQGKGRFNSLQYKLDNIYLYLKSHKVETAIEALKIAHEINNICVARRKILNERRRLKGLETAKHRYFVMSISNYIGNCLV